jgi:magnesium-transporting ATPase (P-type)
MIVSSYTQVGDIILLYENDYAPCDLVLLDTSLTLNKENVAYISTKAIDGKKNLVTKKCPKITACNHILLSFEFKSQLQVIPQTMASKIFVKIFQGKLNMKTLTNIWIPLEES